MPDSNNMKFTNILSSYRILYRLICIHGRCISIRKKRINFDSMDRGRVQVQQGCFGGGGACGGS